MIHLVLKFPFFLISTCHNLSIYLLFFILVVWMHFLLDSYRRLPHLPPQPRSHSYLSINLPSINQLTILSLISYLSSYLDAPRESRRRHFRNMACYVSSTIVLINIIIISASWSLFYIYNNKKKKKLIFYHRPLGNNNNNKHIS